MILSVMLLAVSLGVFGQTPAAVREAPAPAASAPRVVRISGELVNKFRISWVPPQYPVQARMEHLEGTVRLHVLIGTDGRVEKVSIADSTSPVFNTGAIESVKQWRYKIMAYKGEPAEVETTVTMNFALAY